MNQPIQSCATFASKKNAHWMEKSLVESVVYKAKVESSGKIINYVRFAVGRLVAYSPC